MLRVFDPLRFVLISILGRMTRESTWPKILGAGEDDDVLGALRKTSDDDAVTVKIGAIIHETSMLSEAESILVEGIAAHPEGRRSAKSKWASSPKDGMSGEAAEKEHCRAIGAAEPR
jgi:hypothetical protein